MAIHVECDRFPDNLVKKANKFIEGKYLIGMSCVSCPDLKNKEKSYIAMFIAYK